MNASARASTVLLEPSPDEHVNADGNLATIGGQPATGNYCALGRGRQCLYVTFCGAFSPTLQTVLDLCTALWTLYLPFFPRHCVNVATSDPLAPVTHLGRGRRYLLTILSLFSRASSNLGTAFWTRHRLPLRILRDSGNLRSLLWWSTNLDVGASVSSTFVFGTGLQPVRQCLNTVPPIRGQLAIVFDYGRVVMRRADPTATQYFICNQAAVSRPPD